MIQKYSTLPWKKEDTDNLRGFLMTAKPNQALLNVLVDATHEIDYLNYTITGKDAEILRLRELLKEVTINLKDLRFYTFHAAYCVKKSPHVASSDVCDCGYWKACNKYDSLMEKLKQEGVG
jgi:hypothetical protein